MDNKTIYIGLGVIAVVGVAYIYVSSKPTITAKKLNNLGNDCPNANEVKDASGNCVKTGGARGDSNMNLPANPLTAAQEQALENWLHPKCAAGEHLEDIVAPCLVAPCSSFPTCVKNTAGFSGLKNKNYVNNSFFNTQKEYAYGKPS